LVYIQLLHEEVCQEMEVWEALQDAVHIAGVAEVP
jgi:hypothetical protein